MQRQFFLLLFQWRFGRGFGDGGGACCDHLKGQAHWGGGGVSNGAGTERTTGEICGAQRIEP